MIPFLIASIALDCYAQNYTTIVRQVRVNGQPIGHESRSTGLSIRQEDHLQLIVAVRTSSADTLQAAGLIIELMKDSLKQQRIQADPIVEYKGLPLGEYILKIQAQIVRGELAAPLEIRFNVGSHSSHRSTANQFLQIHALPGSTRFPTQLWIVLALATSVISLILASLLLQNRRRRRRTEHDYSRLQEQLESSREQLRKLTNEYQAQLQHLDKHRENLTIRLKEAQLHNKELDQQNQQLRQQVERLQVAKRRLEELQEERDVLLGMVIHDIKNPLLVIENLVQLLRNYDSNSIELHELLNDLAQTTSRVIAISQQVSRLLAIERSDGLVLEFQQVNLSEILRSVTHRNTYLAQRKSIQLIEELPDTLMAECDPQHIEEVFENILSNAIKYSHNDSVVFIRAHAGDSSHTIEIEDHGIGMSSDELHRIFERGTTASSPTGGEPSSGIGLWIVRRLVERHNGRISVRSTKGVGTIVSISLPVLQPTV